MHKSHFTHFLHTLMLMEALVMFCNPRDYSSPEGKPVVANNANVKKTTEEKMCLHIA